MYINDYFFGNVVYFVGLGLSTVAADTVRGTTPGLSYTSKDAEGDPGEWSRISS